MERAENFVKDASYDEFVKDEKMHYAVIRCIEIIGEAAKHMPKIALRILLNTKLLTKLFILPFINYPHPRPLVIY